MGNIAYNLLDNIPSSNPVEGVVDYLELVEMGDITTPVVKDWIPIFELPSVGLSAKHLVWLNGKWNSVR